MGAEKKGLGWNGSRELHVVGCGWGQKGPGIDGVPGDWSIHLGQVVAGGM